MAGHARAAQRHQSLFKGSAASMRLRPGEHVGRRPVLATLAGVLLAGREVVAGAAPRR